MEKISDRALVQGVNELREMTEKEFLQSQYRKDGMSLDDFERIKNSKQGKITIKKISQNTGYLRGGESRTGFVPIFTVGYSCHVLLLNDFYERYYYTSNIIDIDWEKKEFSTLNSVYSFDFTEMTANEFDEEERACC